MIPARRFETIVVPVDFSSDSKQAITLAKNLARSAGPAHLILVHAYFVPVELEEVAAQHAESILEQLSQGASEALEKYLVGLQDDGISSEFIVTRGYPEKVIVELAQERKTDLIVMGTRGRTGLVHLALGSIAEKVVRTAPCPVLTTRRP